jgi:hypothetical protein
MESHLMYTVHMELDGKELLTTVFNMLMRTNYQLFELETAAALFTKLSLDNLN